MCGIAGYFGGRHLFDGREFSIAQLVSMSDALIHRGPDDVGHWVDENQLIALTHRRLSVVDLSATGHQPMVSPSGRYVISFNGEIYNHLSLREGINSAGHTASWRGHSDTETVAACLDTYGIQGAVEILNGMFAIAIWDREKCELSLARDKVGEKPLFYGWQGTGSLRTFLFASELKALKAHRSFVGDINRAAIAKHLQLSYVPGPQSIYKGIYKLQPGCLLTVSLTSGASTIHRYWDAQQEAFDGYLSPTLDSRDESIAVLSNLLYTSVQDRMMGDVPVGAFLSGGIDSSLIVAIMQRLSCSPIKTFTVGFNEQGFDEAESAKQVAMFLGTDHYEFYVSSKQVQELIPSIPLIYDEPFGDASSIPAILVSKFAKDRVTVALSGDGGDELFCGYNRYQLARRLWPYLKNIPDPIKNVLSVMLNRIPLRLFGVALDFLTRLFDLGAPANLARLQDKASAISAASSIEAFHLGLVSHWASSEAIVLGDASVSSFDPHHEAIWGSELGEVQKMMLYDFVTYLPDDILVKMDMASMASSLEVRVPFLDPEIMNFSWRLTHSSGAQPEGNKWILRQILYQHVPQSLVDRPKMGFNVPLDNWLRGPLKGWAEDLLNEKRLDDDGYFNVQAVRGSWKAHLDGKKDLGTKLWNVLVFQAWLDRERSGV